MSTLAILLWVANVASDTTGRLAFKSAAATGDESGRTRRWKRILASPVLWVGVACVVIEFVTWLALVSVIPLSQAILVTTINIVTVAVAGRFVFRERLDARRAAAIGLIAIGVALAGGAA